MSGSGDQDAFNTSADLFANSSSETVMESVDFSLILREPHKQFEKLKGENSSSFLNPAAATDVADLIVSEACDTLRLFCPFCLLDFKFDFLLKSHIESCHSDLLKTITCSNKNSALLHSCPYCNAKFYLQDLLPNHVARKHHEAVIHLCDKADTPKHIQCRFCSHRVLREHYRVFLIHIEKKHFRQFDEIIRSKCLMTSISNENFSNLNFSGTNQMASPQLSEQFSKLMANINAEGSPGRIENPLSKLAFKPNHDSPLKSILKNSPAKLPLNEISAYDNFGGSNSNVSVRRKLRFEIPDKEKRNDSSGSDSSLESVVQKSKKFKVSDENSPSQNCKSKKWFNFFKRKPMKTKKLSRKRSNSFTNIATSTPVNDENDARPLFLSPNMSNQTPILSSFKWKNNKIKFLSTRFKCGLCMEGFNSNAHLVEHLRKQHHGLKFQPQYRCGECEAKFYRNSYLIRHSQIHHSTPFCMTTADKSF